MDTSRLRRAERARQEVGINDVEQAQTIIAELDGKRAAVIARRDAIAGELRQLGYAAHAENSKAAKQQIGKLNAEAIALAGEEASIEARITSAAALGQWV